MPAGMSKAKARQNSKTKASGFSRAKVNAVAKAGKRRPHNIMHDSRGDYIAAPFVPRPKKEKEEPQGYVMMHLVPVNPPGKVDYNRLK